MASDPRRQNNFSALYVPVDLYTGARAIPSLVGRETYLQAINLAVEDAPTTHILYVVGKGGIGKTRLLRHVLHTYRETTSLRVASELIDLYHSRVHSLAGFIGALISVVDGLGPFVEREIGGRIQELAQAEEAGLPLSEVIARRQDVGDAFIETYNKFAKEHRVVLALDTAERLFLYEDPVRKTLAPGRGYASIWNWLLERFLPAIDNTVLLLAGRPAPRDLGEDLQKLQGADRQVRRIDLPGLNEEEALEYFNAVAQVAAESEDERDRRTAQFLRALSKDQRLAVFYTFCDDTSPLTIRPIFLALAIDYLASAPSWPAFIPSLAEAQRLQPGEREKRRQRLGRHLITAIQEDRHPGDELIRALAWLPKGADSTFLQKVTGFSKEEVEEGLEKIRDLSFIKVRPDDNRYFLHDEMYALLQEYGAPPPEEIQREVQAYYREQIRGLRDKIKSIHRSFLFEASARERVGDDAQEIQDIRSQLRDAIVEDVYYRLRANVKDGYAAFYRYIEEAISLADESLDMLLRAELFAFLKEHGEDDQVKTLEDIIHADEAVRWVRRLIAREEYDGAARVIEELRERHSSLIEPGGDVTRADLDVTEAIVRTYEGDLEKAGDLLGQAEETLKPHRQALRSQNGNGQENGPSLERFRVSAVFARLHNNRGYLHRVQGQFQGAEKQYFRALPYWRHVKIEADHANTLTNLAYALALRGKFAAARRHVQDALELRLRLGLLGPTALTLNTRALVELLDGKYREAEKHALQALRVADLLGFRRAEGLAHLTLASCYRFMSEAPESTRADLLGKALEHAEQAMEIFQKIEEPERRVEAHSVKGIVHRERFRYEISDDPDKEKKNADEHLREAMKLAETNTLWVPYLDARMGLAWLYYYAGEQEEVSKHIKEFEATVEQAFPGYIIKQGKFPTVGDHTVLGVFPQVARKHALQGVIHMDTFEYTGELNALREAAKEFALCIEYNHLIADDFRDLRRVQDIIYHRLKTLNNREMKVFYERVMEFKKDCHLLEWLESTFGPYEIFDETAW